MLNSCLLAITRWNVELGFISKVEDLLLMRARCSASVAADLNNASFSTFAVMAAVLYNLSVTV